MQTPVHSNDLIFVTRLVFRISVGILISTSEVSDIQSGVNTPTDACHPIFSNIDLEIMTDH